MLKFLLSFSQRTVCSAAEEQTRTLPTHQQMITFNKSNSLLPPKGKEWNYSRCKVTFITSGTNTLNQTYVRRRQV